MASTIFYELKNGTVLLYDEDGGFGGIQPHLRYLKQADYISTATSENLEVILQRVIAEQLPMIPRRIKHRDQPRFDFIARPLHRDNAGEKLPVISGQYINPNYTTNATMRTG